MVEETENNSDFQTDNQIDIKNDKINKQYFNFFNESLSLDDNIIFMVDKLYKHHEFKQGKIVRILKNGNIILKCDKNYYKVEPSNLIVNLTEFNQKVEEKEYEIKVLKSKVKELEMQNERLFDMCNNKMDQYGKQYYKDTFLWFLIIFCGILSMLSFGVTYLYYGDEINDFLSYKFNRY